MEEAGYQGKYFVLMGHLSPLDGIGPQELGLDKLAAHLAGSPGTEAGGEISEVILATNSTMEGQATAHFINSIVRNMISALPVSPMACRWVVNWNISTVIPSPMPWPAATKYLNDNARLYCVFG